MPQKMVMGNEAIALGALKAGVNLVSGYPGTPSSEIIEYISKNGRLTKKPPSKLLPVQVIRVRALLLR